MGASRRKAKGRQLKRSFLGDLNNGFHPLEALTGETTDLKPGPVSLRSGLRRLNYAHRIIF